ncbi:MAG: hypothetical protein E4H21_04440 [Thermodesulfobacteriales bacterium]|nr:MAG: hypothetical protein E4H21_04440 [Thermodesulfobacteriales bacterium]
MPESNGTCGGDGIVRTDGRTEDDGVGDNGDLYSDNDGIPDNMEAATNGNVEEAITPSEGQEIKAKKVAKFKAGAADITSKRQIQPNPEPLEATSVKSSKSNASE